MKYFTDFASERTVGNSRATLVFFFKKCNRAGTSIIGIRVSGFFEDKGDLWDPSNIFGCGKR